MRKLRYGLIVMGMVLCLATSATADVSIGIGLPNVSIGINLPLFPDLVRVPGYPVYYAPRVDANYFFYDGMYWVFMDDYWYASNWYNGPWSRVDPYYVPAYILRIPVRYYRQPPVYFRGWRANAPPRWGQHWGREWEQRRGGWDKWRRGSAPAPAPLPVYQRQYTGDRYPRQVEQQQRLRSEHYRYQPRDRAVRQHFQQQKEQRATTPAQRGRQEEPRMRSQGPQGYQRPEPVQQGAPGGQRMQAPRQGGEQMQRPPQGRPQPQQRGPAINEQRGPGNQPQRQQPGAGQREQIAPRQQGPERGMQERGPSQEPRQGRGEDRGR
ncbi:MAG: hypothetical protein CXR31_03020 [Geobacter sp.]|nr:MAG: hypothetical protein CXR31_03020 [Geobacter sp.]